MESIFPDLLNGLGDEPKYHYETNVNVLERENRQEKFTHDLCKLVEAVIGRPSK